MMRNKKNSNQKNEEQTGLNEIKCLGTKLKKIELKRH
jgi:hypothetical protein